MSQTTVSARVSRQRVEPHFGHGPGTWDAMGGSWRGDAGRTRRNRTRAWSGAADPGGCGIGLSRSETGAACGSFRVSEASGAFSRPVCESEPVWHREGFWNGFPELWNASEAELRRRNTVATPTFRIRAVPRRLWPSRRSTTTCSGVTATRGRPHLRNPVVVSTVSSESFCTLLSTP